ncbi:MAG TPA: tetratricopeptide repeat protein, partial [Armatimonadota bacterium]
MQLRLVIILLLVTCLASAGWSAPSAADKAYATARQLLETGNPQQAAELFGKFRMDYPQDPRLAEAAFYQGSAYQQLQRYDDALTAYTAVPAQGATPESVKLAANTRFQMAECYYEKQAYDRAAQACRDCLQMAGEDTDLVARAYYQLGRSLAQTGKDGDARLAYDKVIELAPEHPLAPWSLYASGMLSLRQADFPRAAVTLEKAITGYADSDVVPPASLTLGEVYAGQARAATDPAVRAANYAKAVKLLAALQDNVKLPAESRLRAMLNLAQIYTNQQDFERAQTTFAGAIALMGPDHPWLAEAYLQRGHALYNAGRFQDAADAYARAATGKGDPDRYAQALYWLGNSWYQLAVAQKSTSADSEAILAFRRFLGTVSAKHPLGARATLLLALCQEDLARAGNAEARAAAVNGFKDVLAKWPSSKEASQASAGITRLTSSMTRAELESVANLLPDGAASWSVALRLANEQFQAGKYQEAIDAAKKVLAGKPDADLTARAAFLIGAANQRLNHPQEAAAAYRQVLANTQADDLVLYAQRNLAQSCLDSHQFPDALKAAQALVALPQPGKTPAERETDLSERLMLLAEAFIGAKQYAGALAAYGRVNTECPSSPQAPFALMGQAWVAETTRDTAAAVACYQKMTAAFPAHKLAADAWFRLGLLLNEQKSYQPAIDALKHVPLDYPSADQAAFTTAWAYLDLGKAEEAAAQFSKVAEQFPKSPLAGESLYQLGAYLVEKENYPEAVKVLNRAQALLGPDHRLIPAIIFKLAACAMNTGDNAKAAELFGTVAVKYPTSENAGESLFWQAQALENQGAARVAAARDLYLQYVKKYPDGPLVIDAALGGGRTALILNQPAAARADLQTALKLCDALGTGKGAMLAERAQNVAPEAQYDLGQSYFLEKNYKQALTEFAAVAVYSLEPWYSRSLLQMARCNALGGDKAAAGRTLGVLLKNFPKSEAAAQ